KRPAVQQQVVRGPEEFHLAVETEQGKAHQRRLGQGQGSLPVALPQLFEAVLPLRRGEAAPVQLLPGERDLLANDLEGLVETFPEEGRTEHRVALDEPLP